MDQELRKRRRRLERSWRAGVLGGLADSASRADVRASWARSAVRVAPGIAEAPVAAADDVVTRFHASALGRAARVVLPDLSDLASGGDLMAAVTDETVTIAWIAGGRTMSGRADRVHFSPGGCWAEAAVGTNALSLAHDTARPATVFSAEHFAPMVHDWVCYSSPVSDPRTGAFLGVIDISGPWERAHPALLTTVGVLARCVEHELAAILGPGRAPAAPECDADGLGEPLVLRTLGVPFSVHLGGRAVPVTRRQMELLAVLSLHPEGLTLDELTGRVYGDRPVARSTVKAELSHLRGLLGGRIGSRPYRLIGPVDADHGRLLVALRSGDIGRAVELYRGPLFVSSDSPELDDWRRHIDVALRDAVRRDGRPDLLSALGHGFALDAELRAGAASAPT